MTFSIIAGGSIALFFWMYDVFFLLRYRDMDASFLELLKHKSSMIAGGIAVLLSVLASALMRVYGMDVYVSIRYLMIVNACAFLACVDMQERIVPNRYLLGLLIACSIVLAIQVCVTAAAGSSAMPVLVSSLLGMAVCFLCMFIGKLISRGGIGGGDLKLMAVIGLYIGYSRSFALLIMATLIGAIYSVIQLLRKKLTLKDTLPFVPCVAAALFLMIVIGI